MLPVFKRVLNFGLKAEKDPLCIKNLLVLPFLISYLNGVGLALPLALPFLYVPYWKYWIPPQGMTSTDTV